MPDAAWPLVIIFQILDANIISTAKEEIKIDNHCTTHKMTVDD